MYPASYDTESRNGIKHREAERNAAEIDKPEEYNSKKHDLQDSYNPHYLTKLDGIPQYYSNRENVEE